MASSLEDLLAEDGFKGKKSAMMMRSRASFQAEPRTDRLEKDSAPRDRIRTERTRSEASRYARQRDSPKSDHKTARPRDNFVRRDNSRMASGSRREEVLKDKREETSETVKDIYYKSEQVHSLDIDKDIRIDSSDRNIVGVSSFSENKRRETEKVSSNGKIFETVSEPALDEAAIRAIVSVLTRFVKRFRREEEFRAELKHNCLSSLNVVEEVEIELEEESKIMEKLEESIQEVERSAEECKNTKDLKRAVLQLSVIAGLNSDDDRKHAFTSGIPNHSLSAIAHLYLSIVHKLQKKDSLSAKHVLRVFIDSPFLARTNLLPELWDYLFSPNLTHLKLWYKEESDALSNTPGRERKIELLNKVYDEILDSGTRQFAVYYRDWLTEGVGTPAAVPSIHIPMVSMSRGHSSEMSSCSAEPMASHKFYDNGKYAKNSDTEENDHDLEADFSTASNHTSLPENYGQLETAQKDRRIEINVEPVSPQETPKNEINLKSLQVTLAELKPPQSEITKEKPSASELHGLYSEERSPCPTSVPQDFICPLTGRLFEEPATLETGETFERNAIKAWLDQGKTTCPVTSKTLESKQVPSTNLVLKRVVAAWKSRHLSAHVSDHGIANADEFLSLGGLEFLLRGFVAAGVDEETRVASLLVDCVESDPSCGNRIAREIDRKCLTELLHSKQVKARGSALLLLVELICLCRKKDIVDLLSGLKSEEKGIESTMHVILVHLQSSPTPEKPLLAVLLLYFDLLVVEPRKYSIYREEAVDAITEVLDDASTVDVITENCRRTLLILGGRFSSSGENLTRSWILNRAGFTDGSLIDDFSLLDNDDEEEQGHEEWLRKLCESLLGNGKKSFLKAISKCLVSQDSDLVTACLTTVAWLSAALATMHGTELQLPAFAVLIPRLKECLENGRRIEHKVLASTSLFNFSQISECRVLLMSMAQNITSPLRRLAEVTGTARKLYTIVSG